MVENLQADQVARLLKTCSLFRDLSDSDRHTLARYSTRRRCSPGEPIFYTGDPGESLMGVAAGVVRISRQGIGGGEIILADLEPNTVFGEIALLDGQGRSANAVALTNCELVVLERRDLIPFLRQRPDLCLNLLSLICRRLRKADTRSSDFLFLDLSARLAKALLDRTEGDDSLDRPGRLSLTQEELARIIGATRANVNRQLKAWERNGLIEKRKGWIVLVRRDALGVIATGL